MSWGMDAWQRVVAAWIRYWTARRLRRRSALIQAGRAASEGPAPRAPMQE